MPRGDRRDEIIAALERLLTEHSREEITLDDVAREAHIGKGTIYRYFHDKEDLFFQAAAGWFDQLCDALERSVPEDAPLAEQLLGVCEAVTSFGRKRWRLFRMMQSEEARVQWRKSEVRKRWRKEREKLLDTVARIMEKGVTENLLRKDVSPGLLAHLFIDMVRAYGHSTSRRPEAAADHAMVVDIFWHGAGKGNAP